MEIMDKPLSQWTLGEMKDHCVAQTERREWENPGDECAECRLCEVCAITPSEWDLDSAPRLTEAELTICKAVGAKWVSRDKDSAYVTLRKEKPDEYIPGRFTEGHYIGALDENLFPSVALGDCICVEEAEG